MSRVSSVSAGPLQLTIRLTTHPVNPVPSHHPITISREATVADLKEQLHTEWDGKPQPEGIVCVKGGRVCRDQEVLGELFGAETPSPDAVLHVIVRPNSWSAPFTSLPKPTPAMPAEATPASATAPVSPLALPTVPSPSAYNPSYAVLPPAEATAPATPTPEILRNTFTSDLGSPPPPPTTSSQIPSSASLGPNVSGFPTYLAFLSQLIPLQRSLLLLNLQKAHYFYSIDVTERLARLGWAESTGSKIDPIVIKGEGEDAEAFRLREEREKERMKREMEEGNGEVQEVKNLLVECGLWGMVKEKEEEAEAEVRDWGKERGPQNGEFQLVQIGGLPFMLQVPPTEPATPSPPPSLALYRALKRGQAILHILTTMLQLLITYQPSAPAIAYGRALLRPPGAPPVGGVAAGAARAAAAAAAPPPLVGAAAIAAANRRRATVSIVINLEAVLSLIIPLFLLSLKLGFLLWIFGRHASYTKRVVMGSMAAAWILWEGWGMYRRRAVVGALRERADRERERAERQARRVEVAAQAGIQLPMPAPRRPPPPGAAPVGAGGDPRQRAVPGGGAPGAPAPPPGVGHRPNRPHGARPRREPHSRFSPRYWIARIATVGLVEEAHELGLAPRTVAGRQVPQPTPPPHPNDRIGLARQARRRAIRTAMVAVVLFFGTLSPEVERKRKRALEKRERLLAEKRVQRERVAAERAAAASGGGLVVVRPQGLLPPETRSGASTPGLFEGDHGEATHGLPQIPPPAAASPSTPSSPPVTSTSTDPIPSTSQSTSSHTTSASLSDNVTNQPSTSAAGRAVVSDAELFADGLGEPDQDPTAAAIPAAVEADTEGSGGEGDAHEVETETDDEEEQRGQEDDGEVDQVVALF